jgi:WD repeat-containing protein mio
MFDLESVMVECEENREFERSSALAVWHGDIGAAVDALQRGAEYYSTRKKAPLSSSYGETLELVSISIAGYRGGGSDSATSKVWRKACANLLKRSDLSDSFCSVSGAGYLRHVLKFLMSIGIDSGHKDVLQDETLSLCDRAAFACRFLSRDDLKDFIEQCLEKCDETGNIVIFPTDWTSERRSSAEWLHVYRSLLNRWQMWQSRAAFDVDRADLLRKVKLRQTEMLTNQNKSMGRARIAPVRRTGARNPDSDVQAAIPAQLDARCNYCSSPLGLRRQDTHGSPWLSKMKNVLACCPNCRKPLPRCSICMLSLGALNPYMELTKDRSRMGPRGAAGPSSDDFSSLANLPFAEWFTWCMSCKHGGHAHHLVGWFAKHEVCPVSGCDCRCQFDGINKLKRSSVPHPGEH